MVYQVVVVSTLLFGCETWTLYQQNIKNLERFYQTKLQSILGISWEDRVTNIQVLENTNQLSIEATIKCYQL